MSRREQLIALAKALTKAQLGRLRLAAADDRGAKWGDAPGSYCHLQQLELVTCEGWPSGGRTKHHRAIATSMGLELLAVIDAEKGAAHVR